MTPPPSWNKLPYLAMPVKPRPEDPLSPTPRTTDGPADFERLPRGPHGLSPQEVAASQRDRILRAVTDLVAEAGLARSTITGICRRARVAPNAFYEHFSTKDECYLAAYDDFVSEILGAVTAAAGSVSTRAGDRVATDEQKGGGGWERALSEGLAAYLGLLDARPAEARAFVLQVDSAGPPGRDRLRMALNAMARMLRAQHLAARAEDPGLGPLPDAVYVGFVHGVRALVCESMLEDPSRPLADLLPDLALWIGSTVSGAPSGDGRRSAPVKSVLLTPVPDPGS